MRLRMDLINQQPRNKVNKKSGESVLSIVVLMFCALMAFLLLVVGCSTLTPEQIEQGKELIGELLDKGESAPDTPKPGTPRQPVDPMSVPESGEYVPDPVTVLYAFIFDDGTEVRFREEHGRDHWGRFPAAGWGQIKWPDGRLQGFDANRIIRHGGLIGKKLKTPVTTLDHGRRMFWMADAEERKDVKKVTIFEDGWNPLVESAMLGTQSDLGITGNLIRTDVTVEKRK